MAGFDRYENILKLFTQTHSSWTVVEMSARLGARQAPPIGLYVNWWRQVLWKARSRRNIGLGRH